MSLKERIEFDFVEALKTKKKDVLSTLRILKSAIKNDEISQKKELDKEGLVELLEAKLKNVAIQ